MIKLFTLIISINLLATPHVEDKDKKQTRLERKQEKRKQKAIANVKKWKAESNTAVLCTQIAPNK